MDSSPSSSPSKENTVTVAVLGTLTSIYIYLLLSPSQPHLPNRPRNFVIQTDTKAAYDTFYSNFKKNQYPNYEPWERETETEAVTGNYSYGGDFSSEFSRNSHNDDFFFDGFKDDAYAMKALDSIPGTKPTKPTVPSSNFRCQEGWLSIKANINYKYLWMHADDGFLGATATLNSPLHRRAFWSSPLNGCENGWVLLREGDEEGFLMMVPPNGTYALDEWVVKAGSSSISDATADLNYHFLLEEEGYLLNRGSLAFVNVLPNAQYSARGHTSSWDRTKPAGREYGATVRFTFLNASAVSASIAMVEEEVREAEEEDKAQVAVIAAYPKSTEKRVISFGLYGAKEKYTVGAIRNAELASTYFPGWVCRFYVTSDVSEAVILALKALGAEISPVPKGMGYSSGMFWRFMVASDESVDRYIIRDVDSRLNSRDRIAVEDWVVSKYPVHILRDHVNHCIPLNGGMWGGVKNAIPDMDFQIRNWTSRDSYMADLRFLEARIWPLVKSKQVTHDSYCCDRFPNTRPYPTRRFKTYQHVGQVFDSHDEARMADVDGFIRGVPVPSSCRKESSWIYG